MLINYRAPALVNGKRPYPSYDAAMLLKSQSQIEVGEKPEIPPDVFKDKVVFVGIAFSGLVDVFQTPFGAGVDARHSAARERRRQHPVEPVPAPGAAPGPPWRRRSARRSSSV